MLLWLLGEPDRGSPSNNSSSFLMYYGPEMRSEVFCDWAKERGIRVIFIQPGKPTQNAYVERFNRTVRHEWLDAHLFESIEQAQQTATEWLWQYNHERPNMGIGGITPIQKLAKAA